MCIARALGRDEEVHFSQAFIGATDIGTQLLCKVRPVHCCTELC